MPVSHYENFPVASLLLPAGLRRPVEAIYGFARTADDLADEGDATPRERMAALDALEADLDRMARGETPLSPEAARLEPEVRRYAIPLKPLRDLLSAFRQDVVKTRYASRGELLDYCQRSANPVGRLMLHLHGVTSEPDIRWSDAICTSLQLINFLQDVAPDWSKDRIYLPADARERAGVTERHIAHGEADAAWRALMSSEVEQARDLMLSGIGLPTRLGGRVGFELRLVILGGLRVLERIEAVGYDVFRQRPTLGRLDWLLLLTRAASWSRNPRGMGLPRAA